MPRSPALRAWYRSGSRGWGPGRNDDLNILLRPPRRGRRRRHRPGPRSGRTGARRSRLPHRPAGRPAGAARRPGRTRPPGSDRPRSTSRTRTAARLARPSVPSSAVLPQKDGHARPYLRVGRNRYPAKNGSEPMGHRGAVLGEHAKGGIAERITASSQDVQSTSTLPRSRRQRRLAAGYVARLRDARPLKPHCTLPRLLAVQALSFALLHKAYEREGQTVTAIPSPPHPMNFVYVAAE